MDKINKGLVIHNLKKAIREDSLELLQKLFQKYKINPDTYIDTDCTKTLLWYAAHQCKIDITKYLLEQGADKKLGLSPEKHAYNLSFDDTNIWHRLRYKRIANMIANHKSDSKNQIGINHLWNVFNI